MAKILIWGAGNIAQILVNGIDLDNNIIIAFIDNNKNKEGKEFYGKGHIIAPEQIREYEYDILVICVVNYEEIMIQCKNMNLKNIYLYKDIEKIKTKYPDFIWRKKFEGFKSEEIWMKCTYIAIRQIVTPIIENIKTSRKIRMCDTNTSNTNKYIWSCWWQGIEQAPFLVKKCFESIKNKLINLDIKFVIITHENYTQYIQLPYYIIDKVIEKEKDFTHISDIIRIKLLKKYGGLWIDATIYCPNRLIYGEGKYIFYSIKDYKQYWKGYLMYSQPANFLFEIVDRFHMQYWKEKESKITFYLTKNFIMIAFDEFEEVKKQMLKIPNNNPEIETLNGIMNDVYERDVWETINETTSFFKLSNRKEYREHTEDGQLTFWGAFVRGII